MIISVTLVAFLLLPDIVFNKKIETNQDEARYLDSLALLLERKPNEPGIIRRFQFDPNNISIDSLVLLGVNKKIAERLNKYREKGGKFFVKEDIKKIYGFSDQLYDELSAYIELPSKAPDEDASRKTNLDINSTSVSNLQNIVEMDHRIAQRIINFRDALGGFVSKQQFNEVYNISQSDLIKLNARAFVSKAFQPTRVNINSASVEVLASHPYISYELAEDIVRFREINGRIESEKVLVNFNSIDKGNFKRLILYLDFK